MSVKVKFKIGEKKGITANYTVKNDNPIRTVFKISAASASFYSLTGSPYDNANLKDALDAKADKSELESDMAAVDEAISNVQTAIENNYNTLDSKIDNVNTELSGDISTLEQSVNNRIDATNQTVAELSTTVADNNTAINNRVDGIVNSFDGDISNLETAIQNEATTRANNDSLLQGDINTLRNDLTSEISNRTSADNILQDNIDNIKNTIDNYGDIISYNASDFATAAQGLLAESALQPNDNISELNNDAGYLTNADLSGYLRNTATGSNSLTIDGIASNKTNSINIGAQSTVNNYSIALGYYATATGSTSMALGLTANAFAQNSIQIGNGANSTANTLQVRSYTLLDTSTGLIPDERISSNIARSSDIPTFTEAQIAALNSGATNANIGQIATNTSNISSLSNTVTSNYNTLDGRITSEVNTLNGAITGEATNRQNADNALQSQIDAITSASDVFDIVGTYAELQAYDISTVPVNDIIKILVDSTHNNAATYYRCVENNNVKSWSYIGAEGAYYTKSEADNKFVEQTITVNGQPLSSNVTLTASDVGALPSSTTIGAGVLTIQKNGVDVDTFNANATTNKTINITVPTDTNDLTNGAGFITSNALTGYATETWVSNQGYLTAITSSDVTTALGFTPYNSTNPDGYITASAIGNGTVTINQGGTQKGTFTLNQSGNVTIDLDAGGGTPTNMVTTDTVQDITAKKTFIGDKAINFKQKTTSDKLGFTLFNNTGSELAAFEFRPSTIGSAALFNLNLSKASANYVGFRYHGTNAINVACPKVAKAGNYYIPINVTNGTLTVTANNVGTLDISTLLPDVSGFATQTWVQNQNYITSAALTDYVTNTSLATTLADYVTNSALTTTLADYALSADIPTKTSDLTNDSNFATVLQIPTNNNQLTNGAGYITNSALTPYVLSSSLSTVATSGSYNDLDDKPTIPAAVTVDTALSTTSTNPVQNKVITTELNKKIEGITSSDVTTALGYTPYNSSNPSGYQANKIETIKVNGTAQTITNKAVDITVPTNNNQLTNGAGYITSSALTDYVTTNTSQTITANKIIDGADIQTNSTITLYGTSAKIRAIANDDSYRTIIQRTYGANVVIIGNSSDTLNMHGSQLRLKYNNTDVALLTDIPAVGNGTVTINQDGTQKGTFTLNQSGDATIDLDAGGTVDQTFDGTSQNAQSGVAISNAKFIQNIATGAGAISFGNNAIAGTANQSINIGAASEATKNQSIAIGGQAKATALGAIQIGIGTNSTACSLNIGGYKSGATLYNWQLLDCETGLIPDARISTNIARTSQIPTNISALINDSGYITNSALNGYATQTWVGQQGYLTSSALTNYVTNTSLATTLADYVTNSTLTTTLADYQPLLVSGTNIKTINNTSLLGSGNIDVLTNTASRNTSLTIGDNASTLSYTTNVGIGSQATATAGQAFGHYAIAGGQYSLALGQEAEASSNYAIQLGKGTNATATTLSVGFGNNGNYQLLDGSTGLIPDARLSSNIARTNDIPDISNLANTDLSNLSTTGQAVIDGKVSKSGDTMTGALNLDMTTIGGSNENFQDITFTLDDINRAGLRCSHLTDGTNSVQIITRNNSGAIAVGYTQTNNNGTLSCSFPNTKCVDGQWVAKYLSVFSGVSAIGNGDYSISSYLPNDGYAYEVLACMQMNDDGTTSGTDSAAAVGNVAKPLDNNCFRIYGNSDKGIWKPRFNGILVFLGNQRKVYYQITGRALQQGLSLQFFGYRRIGTNS